MRGRLGGWEEHPKAQYLSPTLMCGQRVLTIREPYFLAGLGLPERLRFGEPSPHPAF